MQHLSALLLSLQPQLPPGLVQIARAKLQLQCERPASCFKA